MVARLPQRLKSMLFEIFGAGAASFEKIQITLILAFEANSALSQKNETKIVKITHCAMVMSPKTATNLNCSLVNF